MASEWPIVRLGAHCTKIGSGATPKGGKNVYLEVGEFSLIRSQNVYNDGFSPEGLAFISPDQAKALDGVAVAPNDILVNITGDSVARVCLAPSWVLPARVNQHVAIIRPKPDSFDSRYLRYFLVSPLQQERLHSSSAVGATRNALTKGMLESFELPIPPIKFQHNCAEVLAALDDRIDLLRQTNSTLEAIAQALFKSWFVDFDPVRAKAEGLTPAGLDVDTAALFPDEFEESALGLIPKGWHVGNVKDLLSLQRGFDLPVTERSEGPYPVFAASGFNGHHVEAMVKGPGVTTGRSGVLGKVFYVSEDFWPLNTSLWVKKFNVATPTYAYQFLRSLNLSHLNAGSAVPTLNRNHVHGKSALVPEKVVVDAYSTIAAPLLRRVHDCNIHALNLADLRDTLLPRLISGKLRLPEAEALIEDAVA